MRTLAFSKLKEAKHMGMETDTDTEDPFQRILAFSKLEEAKHMDAETTRWPSLLARMSESQKPRQRVSNADQKVFANPESFCDKFIIG